MIMRATPYMIEVKRRTVLNTTKNSVGYGPVLAKAPLKVEGRHTCCYCNSRT